MFNSILSDRPLSFRSFLPLPLAGLSDPLGSIGRSRDPRKVRILAIGEEKAVSDLMMELHRLGFAEAVTWSLPLRFSESRLELKLEPGETVRIHVWREQRFE